MLHNAIDTLRDSLRPHISLRKDLVGPLALIVIALIGARKGNLSYLAADRELERNSNHVNQVHQISAEIKGEI